MTPNNTMTAQTIDLDFDFAICPILSEGAMFVSVIEVLHCLGLKDDDEMPRDVIKAVDAVDAIRWAAVRYTRADGEEVVERLLSLEGMRQLLTGQYRTERSQTVWDWFSQDLMDHARGYVMAAPEAMQ